MIPHDFEETPSSSANGNETPAGPIRSPRSFAEIHRDLWRLVLQHPAIFICVPVFVWLPIDYLLELWGTIDGLSEGQKFRRNLYGNQAAYVVTGTWVNAVSLASLGEISRGRAITLATALKKGSDLWLGLVLISLHVAFRSGLALLLLVLPGIYLLLRYALAAPVVAFEDIVGKEALGRSATLMRGNYGRVFWGICGAGLLYAPMMLVPFLWIPDDAGPGWVALAGLPASVLSSFIILGLTLIYADIRSDLDWAAPVGQAQESDELHRPEVTSGGQGVALAGLLSTLVLSSWIAAVSYQHHLQNSADEAWEQKQYQESLALYQKAEAWGLEDPYLQYSLGWAYFQLDHVKEAQAHFAEAVEMEPEWAPYRVDHARSLIALERFDEAQAELARARSMGYEDTETLVELEAATDPVCIPAEETTRKDNTE